MRIKAEILQRLLRTGDKPAQRAERFGKCSVDERRAIFDTKFFGRAATVFATAKNGVRFIDEDACAVRLSHIRQLNQFSKIAVHRINSFDDDELAAAAFATQGGVERSRIVVLELFGATTRKHGPIAQTQVRPVIQNRGVALAE